MTISQGGSRTSDILVLFSLVLYGLAVRSGPMSGLAVLVATGTLALAFFQGRNEPLDSEEGDGWFEKRLILAVVVFGLLGSLGWVPSGIIETTGPLEWAPGLIWALLAIVLYLAKGGLSQRSRFILVVLVLGVTVVVGLLHLRAVFDVGIDVVFLHARAADALAAGLNPYTDAVVVANGAPTAQPGDVIVGYVYPPITAFLYSAGYWLFSDPRYTSLLAWIAFLAIVARQAIKTPGRRGIFVLLLLSAMPGWAYVLRASWTEPVSLALIAASYGWWERPRTSGSLLGLALASKQYFAVAAPLLVFNRSGGWQRRAVTAIFAIVVTIGVALVWDVQAFWSAAVEFHTTTPPRSDGSNLVGLVAALTGEVWDPPTVLTVGLGLATGLVTARRAQDGARFLMALAITLSVSFLVSSQAFANYWFLIAGISGLALLPGPAAPATGTQPDAEARNSSEP